MNPNPADRSPLDPREVLAEYARPEPPSASTPLMFDNPRPLQTPNGPEHLRKTVYGGPAAGKDTRIILDRRALLLLAEIAGQSLSGRVVLHGAGIQIDAWRGSDGHVFETWTLLCADGPKPESTPVDVMVRR